jgi:hypothetical protein
MNSEAYKALIQQKDVLDHTTLNVTLKELASGKQGDLAEKIRRIMEQNKIPKPQEHAQPYDTSSTYYRVDLSIDDVEQILEMFFDLEDSRTSEQGEPTPTSSFYAALADKWDLLSSGQQFE